MKELDDIIVAKVIDTDRIVINKGSKDGIDDYMYFLVYELKDEIKDPISGKSLGVLESPKGFFKVIHIQDEITTLISELNKPKRFGTLSDYINTSVSPERDLLSTIRVGDKVKITNKV